MLFFGLSINENFIQVNDYDYEVSKMGSKDIVENLKGSWSL
jgi:hypothetical protein